MIPFVGDNGLGQCRVHVGEFKKGECICWAISQGRLVNKLLHHMVPSSTRDKSMQHGMHFGMAVQKKGPKPFNELAAACSVPCLFWVTWTGYPVCRTVSCLSTTR